jgi:hypothetical protein
MSADQCNHRFGHPTLPDEECQPCRLMLSHDWHSPDWHSPMDARGLRWTNENPWDRVVPAPDPSSVKDRAVDVLTDEAKHDPWMLKDSAEWVAGLLDEANLLCRHEQYGSRVASCDVRGFEHEVNRHATRGSEWCVNPRRLFVERKNDR